MRHLSIKITSYLWYAIGVWLAFFSLQNILALTGIDASAIDVPGIKVLHTERESIALLGGIVILIGLLILAWVWSEFYKNLSCGNETQMIVSPPLPIGDDLEQPNLALGQLSGIVFLYFPAICLILLLGTYYVGKVYDRDDQYRQPYHSNPILSRVIVTKEYFTSSKCTLNPTFRSDIPACQYRVGSRSGVTYIPLLTDAVPITLLILVIVCYWRIFKRNKALKSGVI